MRPFGGEVVAGPPGLTWSVLEGAAGGTMNGGIYTAPNRTGTFHVTATSTADPQLSTTVTVTVVPTGFLRGNDMILPRTAHTMTLLPDGRVLIVGGDPCWYEANVEADLCPLEEAEVFDPTSGTFQSTGSMLAKRSFHTATPLADGKVLMVGGGSANAEFYDPATGQFVQSGSLAVNRSAHTATLLATGNVLVAGGIGAGGSGAEIYVPLTGTFSPTLDMIVPRHSHTATRLVDGTVLITGGRSPPDVAEFTAELFDPFTQTFTATGNMTWARANHTATLLPNGTVLITGGIRGGIGSPPGVFDQANTAEIYDPATGRFSPTGNMVTYRFAHVALLLPDGRVLVTGGDQGFVGEGGAGPLLLGFTAEVYDHAMGTFVQVGSMQESRFLPAAVAFADGRVLVTGGSVFSSSDIYP